MALAEKLHNSPCMLADLRVLGDAVWDRFTAGRDALGYYRDLARAFDARHDLPNALKDEFTRTVRLLELTNASERPADPTVPTEP